MNKRRVYYVHFHFDIIYLFGFKFSGQYVEDFLPYRAGYLRNETEEYPSFVVDQDRVESFRAGVVCFRIQVGMASTVASNSLFPFFLLDFKMG